jgi:hypothetical protein
MWIEQHEIHRPPVSSQKKYRELLVAHGIAYDERYVWGWKKILPPLQGLGLMWVLLTQVDGP